MLYRKDWEKKLSFILRQPGFPKQPDVLHRFIVELSMRRKTDRLLALIDSYSGKIHYEIKMIPSFVVELPYSSLAELAGSVHVKKVWHDTQVFALLDIAAPAVSADKVQEMGFTGKGITVAVLDTGVFPHKDLTTPSNRILAWHDLVNQRSSPYDDNGHGTHISGIIAGNGRTSNGKYRGLAPEARLVELKVMDQDGSGTASTVITGIEWCLQNQSTFKIRAINLSLGTTAQESYKLDPLCRATSIAWRKGMVVCTAAGNEGPGVKTIDSPGINPMVITVGNVDDRQTLSFNDDRLNQTSSRGPTIDNLPKPDLLAPGTEITSLWTSGGYRSLTGTSMSTPVVTGAVAQIIQKWPAINPDQVKKLLLKNAENIGLGPDLQGAGALNLKNIFRTQAPQVKANNELLKKILGYHLVKNLLDRAGQDTALIKKKRDELIQTAVLNFLGSFSDIG